MLIKPTACWQKHIHSYIMVQMVGDAPRVSIKTSMGNFEVELYVKHAPRSCKNFIELAKRGYYNGTIVSTFKPYCLHPARNQEHNNP